MIRYPDTWLPETQYALKSRHMISGILTSRHGVPQQLIKYTVSSINAFDAVTKMFYIAHFNFKITYENPFCNYEGKGYIGLIAFANPINIFLYLWRCLAFLLTCGNTSLTARGYFL